MKNRIPLEDFEDAIKGVLFAKPKQRAEYENRKPTVKELKQKGRLERRKP